MGWWRETIDIVKENDPAARTSLEVLLTYPGVKALVIGETAIVEKGVMLYHGVTLGGTGKDTGKRHPTVREGALVSAHAQVIGPIEIGAKAKVGAGAVVVSDVPSDVTVVGVPAKIVRVHGKKDEPIIHQEEEKREYYVQKLEHRKEASHASSSL